MDTTLQTSPPTTTTNLRRPHHLPLRRNVQYKPQFHMPLIDLTLRLIPSNQFQLRLNRRPNPISPNSHIISSICTKIMADEPKKTDIQPGNAESMKLSEVGKSKDGEGSGKTTAKACAAAPPPPPEKPLPGDCCGSGCVRCVWDVYYEELDEYDRLYKAN